MSDEAQAAFGAAAPHRRPSRAGYWIGALLITLAIPAAILWAVLGFMRFGDAVDDLARVPIPAGGEVRLTAGEKSIYYEAIDAQERTPALRIAIREADGDGRDVEIGEHSGSVTYSLSGHTGQSVASARIPRDGRYLVTVTGGFDGSETEGLAIGDGLGGRIVRILVGGFAIFLLGGIAGTVLIVATQRRRRAPPQGAAGVALPMR